MNPYVTNCSDIPRTQSVKPIEQSTFSAHFYFQEAEAPLLNQVQLAKSEIQVKHCVRDAWHRAMAPQSQFTVFHLLLHIAITRS